MNDAILLASILFIIIILVIIGLYFLVKLLFINRRLGMGILCLAVLLIGYTIYDNNRVLVREQTVYIDGLSASLENFKILQVSDLHGSSFGNRQSNLVDLINAQDYDIIVFTGDMEANHSDFEAFLILLDNIDKRSDMLYINGNQDDAYCILNGRPTQVGYTLSAHGCKMLNYPYLLNHNGSKIWFVNELTTAYYTHPDVLEAKPSEDLESTYPGYIEYHDTFKTLITQIKDDDDIKIGVSHVPLTVQELNLVKNQAMFLDYDLMLAGHNHGGQIRIPCFGSVYIPTGLTLRDRFFPNQKNVSGLFEYSGYQQYISRGLGASNIPFRFLNPPEMNLLILQPRKL